MSPETFRYGPVVFDVAKAKEITRGRTSEEVATERLYPVLGFLGCWPDRARELPDRVLDEPLIIASLENSKLVIDGLHRIWAANDRGRETLNTVTLTRDETLAIQSGPITI